MVAAPTRPEPLPRRARRGRFWVEPSRPARPRRAAGPLPADLLQIHYFHIINAQGQHRIGKWYKSYTTDEKARLIPEIHRLITARDPQWTKFIEFHTYKLIYRKYASLYFIMAVDLNDNEMICLETIHLFVEVLDGYFKDVQEKHIIFNFNKVYQLLDEYICGGEILETNKAKILVRMAEIDRLEASSK